MKRREPGLDLIRCMGLFFVIGVHSFLKNGFYYEPQVGFAIWAADSFRWLFYGCNGIFMMLTGYLISTKSAHYYRGLIPILIGYTLTCLISYPIRHFLLGEVLPLSQWLMNFVTFSNYSWYIEMYIGLVLLSPFINLILSHLKSYRELMWFAGTMAALTALPGITALNLIPDYWTVLYPITYYVIGAVIRRLQPKFETGFCLAGAFSVSMALGLVSVLTTDEGFSKGFTTGYGGFWVTLTVTLLFLGLYRLEIPKIPAKVLAWCSGGVLEGYILSRLLDVWVYSLFPQWHTPAKYGLIFLFVSIPIYICAILSGNAVHRISVLISKKLPFLKNSEV